MNAAQIETVEQSDLIEVAESLTQLCEVELAMISGGHATVNTI